MSACAETSAIAFLHCLVNPLCQLPYADNHEWIHLAVEECDKQYSCRSVMLLQDFERQFICLRSMGKHGRSCNYTTDMYCLQLAVHILHFSYWLLVWMWQSPTFCIQNDTRLFNREVFSYYRGRNYTHIVKNVSNSTWGFYAVLDRINRDSTIFPKILGSGWVV